MAPASQDNKKAVVKKAGGKKGVKTSWINYMSKEREAVKNAHPEMDSKEIMKELGSLWKAMPDSAKEKYNIM